MEQKMLIKEVITKTLIYSDGSIETNVEEVCHVKDVHMQLEDKLVAERKNFIKMYRKAKGLRGLSEELGMSVKELEEEMVRLGVTSADKYGVTDEDIIEMYTKGKMSIAKISKEHNMSKARVQNILFKHNVEANDSREYFRITNEHDEEIVRLYNEGMKKSDIARTVGMPYSQTRRRLRMLGCDIVDISEATERELYIINSFKECGTIAKTNRKTGIVKIKIENVLLKFGIPFGYRVEEN